MPATSAWIAFSLVCAGLALTPGPNMVYLISRALSQGRNAALVSLIGTCIGFLVYMLFSAMGITALLSTVPLAYDALRIAGALYLAWLAFQALKPGGRSPFQVRELAPDSPRRLVLMGFLTNLLNPKAAVMYLSLLPPFIQPKLGHVLSQSLWLGFTQIAISVTFNATIVFLAGMISLFLSTRPRWMLMQRWLMGSVLGVLAVRMATSKR
ncbi:threonine/homoserine/homoserine lactone efflux protein [Luteibacter sp. HA06]